MKIKELLNRLDFGMAFRGWPVASIISVAATMILIIWIAQDNLSDQSTSLYLRLSLSLYVGFLVAIIAPLTLYPNRPRLHSHLITTSAAVISALLWYFILPKDVTAPNQETYWLGYAYPIQIAIFHLAISIAAFWKSNAEERNFLNWNVHLLRIVFEGLLFVIVLMLGLSLALLALDHLFGININEKPYQYLIVGLLGVFHPWFVLSKTPNSKTSYAALSEQVGLRILTQYILIPIVILYMIILYLYGVKILIEGTLPQGWLGKLSLGFCSISLFTYCLNSQLNTYTNKKISYLFQKWLQPVLILPIVLLLIAIGRRIQDYGITENRYLVATLGVWLFCVSIVYTLKKSLSIKWIPLSLGVMLAFSLCSGPLNIFNSTIRSQQNRLKLEFEKAGILEDGILKKSINNSVDIDLSILNFLSDRVDFKQMPVFENNDLDWPSDIRSQEKFVIEEFGLQDTPRTSEPTAIYYYANQVEPIDISNFNLAIPFRSQDINTNKHIRISKNQEAIIVSYKNEEEFEISGTELYNKKSLLNDVNSQPPLVIEVNNRVALHLNEFNLEVENGSYKISYCRGILFINTQN